MSKIFVLQDTARHNYSNAEAFGEVIFCTAADIVSTYGLFGSPRNAQVMADIFNILSMFRQEDYLMISGNPIIIAVALHSLLGKFPSVKVLKWDNMRYQYDPVTISNSEIPNYEK